MAEEPQKQLLMEILRVLEEKKSLFILANQEKLSQAKKGLLPEGTVKVQIYDLCDGTRTTQDISDAIKKSPEFVRSNISRLRREGLIRTVEKDGKQVYEQIF
jgi:DNA-binding transcriptional ArsR family regulator